MWHLKSMQSTAAQYVPPPVSEPASTKQKTPEDEDQNVGQNEEESELGLNPSVFKLL